MPTEPTTGADTSAETEKTPGGAGTAGTDTATSGKSFTQADLDRIIGERLVADREQRRKEAETARLTEEGKHKELADQLKGQLTAAQTEIRDTRLESMVTRLAGQLGIVDADAALRLMDVSAVQWAEDRPTEASVKAALKALVETRPFLVPGESAGGPANPARKGKTPNEDDDLEAWWRQRSRGSTAIRL